MTRRAAFLSLGLGFLLATPSFGLELCRKTSAELEAYPKFLSAEIHRRSAGEVLFTYIVTPSFSSEYGFALTKAKSGYSLSAVKFTESVWYGSVEEREPGTFYYVFKSEKVRAKTTQVRLDDAIAERMVDLLNTAIEATKRAADSNDGRYGFDGVSYRVSAASGDCIETWSPDPKTYDANFIDALDALHFSAKVPTGFVRTIWQKRAIKKWQESASP